MGISYHIGVRNGQATQTTTPVDLPQSTLPQVVTPGAGTIDPATFQWCDDQLADAEQYKRVIKGLSDKELADLMNAPKRMNGKFSPINDLCELANFKTQPLKN